ncbi:MAG: hypothetical protein SPI86_02360 [Treponemataceae bacterium]|nr:hypothetical protein [Spirochaetales bacterium]MDY6030584.1 hypothetical protein [Treponemataceae bacterium]
MLGKIQKWNFFEAALPPGKYRVDGSINGESECADFGKKISA